MFCSKFLTIWLQGSTPLTRIGTMLTFQYHKIPEHIWIIFVCQIDLFHSNIQPYCYSDVKGKEGDAIGITRY